MASILKSTLQYNEIHSVNYATNKRVCRYIRASGQYD